MIDRLSRVKKDKKSGLHRSAPPEKTLGIVRPLLPEIGVTETDELTPYDRIGVPCLSAQRPRAVFGGSKYVSGRGLTPAQAEVSCLMEAVERSAAEYRRDELQYLSWDEVSHHRAIDPLRLFPSRRPEPGERLHWSTGFDLLSGEDVLVPGNAVFHPYDTLGMTIPLFRSDPCGLAAGSTVEEAVLYAILEVLERDAMSRAETSRAPGRGLEIDAPCPARPLIDRFASEGIEVHLWLLDGPTSIPVVAAAADDRVEKDPSLLVMGSCCHPDPGFAALCALTEVAENRGVQLQGGRLSGNHRRILEKTGYDRFKRINHHWFGPADTVLLSSLPDRSAPYIDDDIRFAVQELRAHTDRVCICDLTRTRLPVVRAVIPGLEVSYGNRDRVRT